MTITLKDGSVMEYVSALSVLRATEAEPEQENRENEDYIKGRLREGV